MWIFSFAILACVSVMAIVEVLRPWWGRFRARHTQQLDVIYGALSTTEWIGWHEFEGQWTERGWYAVRVFHLRVPFVLSWRRSSSLANFQIGWVEGWHTLLVMRVALLENAPNGPCATWKYEWIPTTSCKSVPFSELMLEIALGKRQEK